MQNKNLKARAVSVLIHICFVVGLTAMLTTYAQDEENAKDAVASCEEAAFEDIKEARPRG